MNVPLPRGPKRKAPPLVLTIDNDSDSDIELVPNPPPPKKKPDKGKGKQKPEVLVLSSDDSDLDRWEKKGSPSKLKQPPRSPLRHRSLIFSDDLYGDHQPPRSPKPSPSKKRALKVPSPPSPVKPNEPDQERLCVDQILAFLPSAPRWKVLQLLRSAEHYLNPDSVCDVLYWEVEAERLVMGKKAVEKDGLVYQVKMDAFGNTLAGDNDADNLFHLERVKKQFAVGGTAIAINTVTYFVNHKLECEFEEAKAALAAVGRDTGETILFHGTKECNAQSVLETGFRVGDQDTRVVNGSAWE